MSWVSWVLIDTAGLLLESASVNDSVGGGSVVPMTAHCPQHPLQVLSVLCCAAGEPHHAAAGQ